MTKILLTGATGFIGSNIAKKLLENGYNVYATHRNTSSFEKCTMFRDKINWINTDLSNWREKIRAIKPDQLIHTAWIGIESDDRSDWDIQLSNFWLSKEYFDLAEGCGVKKIIAFGSQAEYGSYISPVNEETVPKPDDAYGSVKTLTSNYLRNLFGNSAKEWYWIRIFSVFGEGEKTVWLIPFVITNLLRKKPVQLTSCDQQYDYMYIEDFSNQFLSVVHCRDNKSGIYNICSSKSIILKDLLLEIADLLSVPHSLLQFGSIPQRYRQNMFIKGDNSKFKECFSIKDDCLIGLTNGLIKAIEYYKQKVI